MGVAVRLGGGGGVRLVDGTTCGIGVELDPGMQDIYAMPCNRDARGGTAMLVSELARLFGGWGMGVSRTRRRDDGHGPTKRYSHGQGQQGHGTDAVPARGICSYVPVPAGPRTWIPDVMEGGGSLWWCFPATKWLLLC